jgi:putative phage-type endonuclease
MMDMEQGSPEWFAVRCGKVTASRIADIIAKTKSGPSASRANYAAQLIAERLTNTVAESYSNAAMEWGSAMEPEARTAYEFLHNSAVTLIGFVEHPTLAFAGASPDGLVGDDGLVEIKCPNTATHIDTLIAKTVPNKYVPQMQWQMACTGRAWCDFVSYDPRLPESMRLFVKRVPRDPATITELESEVTGFLFEVASAVSQLTRLYGEREAA